MTDKHSKMIAIARIRTDGGTQPRSHLDEAVVAEYAEAVSAGAAFPPVTVFFDGSDHWLADGFHRFHANRKLGCTEINADCRTGTLREAILFSYGANGSHGLRRSNEDKRRSVLGMLADSEWSTWTDNAIAKACGVDHKTVAAHRASHLGISQVSPAPVARTYTTKHGSTSTMNTVAIGKSRPAPVEQPARPAKVQTPEKALAARVADDAHSDFDPLAALEAANAEIETLHAQLDVASADDLKGEAIRWRRMHQVAEKRQAQIMDESANARKHTEFLASQLKRCGRAVGETDPDKIAPTVEAFVRKHGRKAA